MANFTEESLVNNEAPLAQPKFIGADVTTFSEEDKRQANIENSHYTNNNAFLREAMKNNTLIKVLNAASDYAHQFEPDENFTIDDDTTNALIQSNELAHKYWGEIRQSKSQKEVQHKINKFRQESYYDNVINNTLSDNARTTAAVVGNIADVELVGGLAIGGMYSLSTNIAKVAMYEGAFEASMAVTNYVTDEKYTVEDGFIDTMFGTVIASGATQLAKSLDNTRSVVQAKASYAEELSSDAEVMSRGNYTFSDGYQTNVNSVTGEVEIIKTTPDDGVIRGTAREHAVDNVIRGVGRVSENGEALTKTGKVVPADEVNRINENRSNFFKTQAKTEEQFDVVTKANKATLKATEDSLATLNKKLGDMETQGKTKKQTYDTRKKITEQRKKLEETKAKIDGEVKPKGKERDINLQRQVDAVSENIVEAKIELEEIVKGAKNDELAEISELTDALAKDFPDEFKIVNDLLKSKMNNKKANPRFKNLTPKQKKLLAGAAIVLTGTSASAADGDGQETLSAVGIMLIGIAAFAFKGNILNAVSNIKNANARDYVTRSIASIKRASDNAEIAASQQGRVLASTRTLVADSISTRFTSTVAPLLKIGGKTAEIANKLLYSAQHGAGVETLKHNLVRATMSKYANVEKTAYRDWKVEQKVTGFKSIVEERVSIEKFRKEVSKYIETKHTTSPAVREMAETSEELLADMYKINKDYGTVGFDKIDHKSGWIPRLWNSGKINKLLSTISDTDKTKVRDSLALSIFKGGQAKTIEAATETADKFMSGWSAKQLKNSNDAEDIYGRISHLMKDDAEFDDFTDALTVYGDRNSRAKYRVEFDINDFDEALKDITVNIDGVDTHLSMDNFVDRDMKSIMDKTANTMYGSAAMSSRGYTSVRKLTREIDEFVTDPHANRELHQVVKLITGEPLEVTSPLMHTASMMVKDLTIFMKLPLVALSTPTEIIHTLGGHGFMKSSKAIITSAMAQFGKDSEMMRQLSDLTGLGNSTARLDFHHYGYSDDMIALDDAGVASKLRNGTMKLRDATILLSGLSTINDILQRANLALNAEQFAKHLDSGDAILTSRLQSYGIDDATMKMFKGSFKFNENGALEKIDMSGWSRQKKDKFSEVLMDMNQQYTPETTIGETPLFSKTNDLGRAFTTLTSYSLHQFNVHGIQDIRTMDRIGFLHSVGALGGTYIGLHARYAIQDKEVDEDTLLLYALMNQPQLLGIAAVRSMLDPAVVQTTRQAADVIRMD